MDETRSEKVRALAIPIAQQHSSSADRPLRVLQWNEMRWPFVFLLPHTNLFPPCSLSVLRCMPGHINQRCLAGTERGCHTTELHSTSWIGRKRWYLRCKRESRLPLDGWHFEFMWILIRRCSDARHCLHFKTCTSFFL